MNKLVNFDPNMNYCGRMSDKTVWLIFGLWQYRATKSVVVGGNTSGLSVIDCAVNQVWDSMEADELVLENPENGDRLLAQDNDGKGEDFLRDMLISATIIDVQPEAPEAPEPIAPEGEEYCEYCGAIVVPGCSCDECDEGGAA